MIVYEYFVFDENGEVLKFFKNLKGYVKEVDRKKWILSGFDVCYFWIMSVEFRDGMLFDKFWVWLLVVGIVLCFCFLEEVFVKFKDIGVFEDFDFVVWVVL